MKKFTPYHLVSLSPWPFFTSLVALSFAFGVIIMVRTFSVYPFLLSLVFLLYASYLWGRDVHREGCYEGCHNNLVVSGFKAGMVIFILSECFFFLGMFWSYFHLAESPSVGIGGVWPPFYISVFDPKGIPFLNTILLVSSGVSATWCHHSVEQGDYNSGLFSLLLTLLLGATFTSFQLIEYYVAGFTFGCSSYSSVYFMGTGFHGIHVIMGSVLLFICFFRLNKMFVSPLSSVGFECSLWYWHFVDVIWFLLYLIFYWWGI